MFYSRNEFVIANFVDAVLTRKWVRNGINLRQVRHRYQCDECQLQCKPSRLVCHSSHTVHRTVSMTIFIWSQHQSIHFTISLTSLYHVFIWCPLASYIQKRQRPQN